MNHKDDCDRSSYRYSGYGYNRVKVCACGAEDHAPEWAAEAQAAIDRLSDFYWNKYRT
jgi:hypothetical protein